MFLLIINPVELHASDHILSHWVAHASALFSLAFSFGFKQFYQGYECYCWWTIPINYKWLDICNFRSYPLCLTLADWVPLYLFISKSGMWKSGAAPDPRASQNAGGMNLEAPLL
jgi:hypothetical protein